MRPVDLLVNNAGFGLKGSFLDNELADEEAGLDVMVRAVMLTSHAAGRAMRERGRGAILNVSSVASFIANGTYSAEKAFVTVFSEGLASELAGTGVTVTALCPGFTHTEFHARAGIAMSALPESLWLDADDVVQQALTDVAKGKVVSVPGAQWKVVTAGVRVLPRRSCEAARCGGSTASGVPRRPDPRRAGRPVSGRLGPSLVVTPRRARDAHEGAVPWPRSTGRSCRSSCRSRRRRGTGSSRTARPSPTS